jgi:hypothetical protein
LISSACAVKCGQDFVYDGNPGQLRFHQQLFQPPFSVIHFSRQCVRVEDPSIPTLDLLSRHNLFTILGSRYVLSVGVHFPMIRQYRAQRFTFDCPPAVANKQVGTIGVGTIVYIQDGVKPLGGLPCPIVCREPWIVEAWLPRDYSKWDCNLKHFRTVRISGGHLAQVRSLRDRRRVKLAADWILLECIDAGLKKHS